MATTKYIILTNSDSSLSRRFTVMLGSFKRTYQRKQSLETTVGGDIDMAQGSTLEMIDYGLKVKASATSPEGDIADLRTFYGYSDPGGTPSDVITLTDNLGNSFNVYMVGDLSEVPLAYLLEGDDARYIYQIRVVKIPS